jgi:dolichol-phosphate mannosyltransferase
MKAVVVIPTYNEAKNVADLTAALQALPLDLSILFVDDNSPDGTGDVLDRIARRYRQVDVLHRPQKDGLRAAYVAGFRAALQTDAEIIAQMDADFSHRPAKLPALVKAAQFSDVAIGSRYIDGGGVDRDWSPFRRFLSRFGNAYARAWLGYPYTDATGAFRAWRADALTLLDLETITSNGYCFLIEMLYRAWRNDFVIREVPIYFAERNGGDSKMSLRIQLEAAMRIPTIRLQEFQT